jgi:hypothetical protein
MAVKINEYTYILSLNEIDKIRFHLNKDGVTKSEIKQYIESEFIFDE